MRMLTPLCQPWVNLLFRTLSTCGDQKKTQKKKKRKYRVYHMFPYNFISTVYRYLLFPFRCNINLKTQKNIINSFIQIFLLLSSSTGTTSLHHYLLLASAFSCSARSVEGYGTSKQYRWGVGSYPLAELAIYQRDSLHQALQYLQRSARSGHQKGRRRERTTLNNPYTKLSKFLP